MKAVEVEDARILGEEDEEEGDRRNQGENGSKARWEASEGRRRGW